MIYLVALGIPQALAALARCFQTMAHQSLKWICSYGPRMLERCQDSNLQMLMCHTRKQESLQQIHPCLLLQVGGSKIRIEVSEQIFRSLSACHVCGCINLKNKKNISLTPSSSQKAAMDPLSETELCTTWQHDALKRLHPTPIKWMHDKVMFSTCVT